MENDNEKSQHGFRAELFLGGTASMSAAALLYPLDTIKVMMQAQKKAKLGMINTALQSIKLFGPLSLYNGLSASLLRQGTYSTTRFIVYEWIKERLLQNSTSKKLTMTQSVMIAGLGGGLGTIFGQPADLVSVRMQNDLHLPLNERRNYSNCFEAIYRIGRTEGFLALYTGFQMSTLRGVLVTIGQLAFYDQFKTALLTTDYFQDNIYTHMTASILAGFMTTGITMPPDVVKTLLMNGKPGEYDGVIDAARKALKNDKLALFRGFMPRYIRLGPFTTLTFVFYEQYKLLAKHFHQNKLSGN